MRKSKFSGEQIAYVLRQVEGGVPIADVCRRVGVSEATCCRWRYLLPPYAGICMENASRTARPPLVVRRCSMTESISIRSMYRLLKRRGESRERRDQLTHPHYKKPGLLATGLTINSGAGTSPSCWGPPSGPILSLRDLRCVQPLCHRLDGDDARKRKVGQAADRGELRETIHPAGPAHAVCRSRHLDEFQAGGFSAGRLGCHQNAQPPAFSSNDSSLLADSTMFELWTNWIPVVASKNDRRLTGCVKTEKVSYCLLRQFGHETLLETQVATPRDQGNARSQSAGL
jgi:putative transposase